MVKKSVLNFTPCNDKRFSGQDVKLYLTGVRLDKKKGFFISLALGPIILSTFLSFNKKIVGKIYCVTSCVIYLLLL